MINLKIKPLSVNECWQGKRFKTKAYLKYEKDLLLILPKIKMPEPPFEIYFEVGFSNKGSDLSNILKPFEDILQKQYRFNDNQVYSISMKKKIVKKGNEYISFEIKNINIDKINIQHLKEV